MAADPPAVALQSLPGCGGAAVFPLQGMPVPVPHPDPGRRVHPDGEVVVGIRSSLAGRTRAGHGGVQLAGVSRTRAGRFLAPALKRCYQGGEVHRPAARITAWPSFTHPGGTVRGRVLTRTGCTPVDSFELCAGLHLPTMGTTRSQGTGFRCAPTARRPRTSSGEGLVNPASMSARRSSSIAPGIQGRVRAGSAFTVGAVGVGALL